MSDLQIILFFCLFFGLAIHVGASLSAGQLEPIDKDNPDVIFLTKWAAKKLNGTLIKVINAQRQVVAGWMYHINMKVESNKNKMMQCEVKIWVRHWLNSVRLVSAKCTPVHAFSLQLAH